MAGYRSRTGFLMGFMDEIAGNSFTRMGKSERNRSESPDKPDTVEKTIPAFSKKDFLPVLGLIVLTMVLYFPLFTGRPVMPDTWERFEPWNSELGYDGPLDPRITNANNDAILLYIPWNKFAHDELNAGRIPAWDPYCLSGVPLASNHLVPVFYPPYYFIAKYAEPLFIMGWSGFVHTLIMAFFFYLFLREFLSRLKIRTDLEHKDEKDKVEVAAERPKFDVVRISAWMASSFLIVSMLPNPHYQPWPMTLAWFPAIWFFYERWLKHRSPWMGLWMALAWACPMLSGYPSLFMQLSLFTAVWFFIRPIMFATYDRPKFAQILMILALPFTLAVGLSAIQNIPTVMASMESDRSVFKSVEELRAEAAFTIPPNQPWQTHVKRLLQPMIPFKFAGNDFFNRGYVGFAAILFAFFGLGFYKHKNFPMLLFWFSLLLVPFALIPAVNFYFYFITRGILIDPNPPVEVLEFLILIWSAVGLNFWAVYMIEDFKDWSQYRFGFISLLPCFIAVIYWAYFKPGDAGFSISDFSPQIFSPMFIFVLPSISRKGLLRKEFVFLVVYICIFFAFLALYAGHDLAPDTLKLSILSSDETSKVSDEAPLLSHHHVECIREPMYDPPAITALKDITDPSRGGEWGRIIRYHDGPINVMSMTDQPYTFYPNLGTYFGIPDAFGYFNLAPKEKLDELRALQPDAVIEKRGIVAFTKREVLDAPRLREMGVKYVLSDAKIDGLEQLYAGEKFYIYKLAGPPVHPDEIEFRYIMPGLKEGIIVTSLSGIVWAIFALVFLFKTYPKNK